MKVNFLRFHIMYYMLKSDYNEACYRCVNVHTNMTGINGGLSLLCSIEASLAHIR